jgi:hypothetical protein
MRWYLSMSVGQNPQMRRAHFRNNEYSAALFDLLPCSKDSPVISGATSVERINLTRQEKRQETVEGDNCQRWNGVLHQSSETLILVNQVG